MEIVINSDNCTIQTCIANHTNDYWGCICYKEVCPGLVSIFSEQGGSCGSTMIDVVAAGYDDNAAFIAALDEYNAGCCAKGSGGEAVPVMPGKQVVGTQLVVDPENPKQNIILYLQQDPVTKEICWTTDIEGNNIVDINNYEMSGVIGAVISENLAAKTHDACVTLCILPGVVHTEVEILAAAVAAGVLLPDGTEPTGVINGSVSTLNPGQTAIDADGVKKKLKAPYCIVSGGQVINYGSSLPCPNNPLIDEDCDGFLVGQPVAVENTGTEAGAYRFCGTFIPLDADDTDDTVNGAAK